MRTTFRMEDKNISMIRGDTLAFNIELLDENNEPFTDELDSICFTCKSNKSDDVKVFQKSLDNGITNEGNGVYTVRVAPEDTENVKAGKFYYDLEIRVNGDVFTFMHGILEIEQDVTY